MALVPAGIRTCSWCRSHRGGLGEPDGPLEPLSSGGPVGEGAGELAGEAGGLVPAPSWSRESALSGWTATAVAVRVPGQRVHGPHLEHQGLARGRAGPDDEVLLFPQPVPGQRMVAVALSSGESYRHHGTGGAVQHPRWRREQPLPPSGFGVGCYHLWDMGTVSLGLCHPLFPGCPVFLLCPLHHLRHCARPVLLFCCLGRLRVFSRRSWASVGARWSLGRGSLGAVRGERCPGGWVQAR